METFLTLIALFLVLSAYNRLDETKKISCIVCNKSDYSDGEYTDKQV